MEKISLIAAVTLVALIPAVALECQRRNYGRGSVVCVCNSKYCDFVGDIGPLPSGAAVVFESNKKGLRFNKTTIPFLEASDSGDNDAQVLVLNASKTYQTFFGVGGAFTDATVLNLQSLPTRVRDDILKSYYSTEGIEYSIGRIPMGSCDFSERKYTYDDCPGDFGLSNFTLAPEDIKLKIPYIKKAMALSSKPIWFFGSAWSSPAWMKTTNKLEGEGVLKGEPGGRYYKTWANYYVRFVQEYERRGVPIWGLTTQNEPTSGFLKGYRWQTLGFTPDTQRDFVKLDLGPALAKAGYGPRKLKIMIVDDNRVVLPWWTTGVLSDRKASKYIHGIAVHWDMGGFTSPRVLDRVHERYPDKFILTTEACTGASITTWNKVALGYWKRAEKYATSILQDVNHWTSGWTDWNLVLNTEGGPNWAKNFADSPIIVNATAKEFYKQPMYYALGHFSKFIPRGSVRIHSRLKRRRSKGRRRIKLRHTAFRTPDSAIVVVVLNRSNKEQTLKLKDLRGSQSVRKTISKRSITTFIWRPRRTDS